RPAGTGPDAAAHEGGGGVAVPGGRGVEVGGGDDAHLLDREAGLVEPLEHADDVLGDARVDDHLAGVVAAVEAPEAHGEVAEVLEADGAVGVPGLPHPLPDLV